MSAASQVQRWARYWSEGGVVGIAIGLAIAVVAVVLLAMLWIPLTTVAVALAVAKRRWPRVRVVAYFTSRKAALPVLAAFSGWGAAIAAASLTSRAPETLFTVIGGLMVAGALSLLIAIFQEKIMKSVFQLVPVEQRKTFEQRLDELDNSSRSIEGQAADFSNLDQSAVTQAIETRVIGQDSTVSSAVATAFRRGRLAQTRPNKPVATFLLVGATGSGKTELAKALAAEMFGGRLIRVDCNELSAESNVSRLVGASPGYVGSADGSAFCRDLARTGTGVLLLDEIEKAHPAVLKVLMTLLDEARITEQSTSRTYSARGFLIVLTSNAAQAEIGKIAQIESDPTDRDVKVKDALRDAGFLPEVLARIDAVFPFAPLPARAVASIVERFLLQFSSDAGVELVSCDAELLLDLVTKANKTRGYGIREVVRSVENAVVDGLLAMKDGGNQRAAIRVRDGKVAVEPA